MPGLYRRDVMLGACDDFTLTPYVSLVIFPC